MACSGCQARRQAIVNGIMARNAQQRTQAVNTFINTTRTDLANGAQAINAQIARLGGRR